MTTKRLAVAGAAVACALVGTAALPLASVSADGSAVTVTPATEAWYQTAQCSLPTGCGAAGDGAPATPYPADTLHVGVVAGTETDRSYVAFTTDALPADASMDGGTLTVPLDTAPQDGSQSADAAHVDACLVTGPVTKVRASFAAPPPATCDTKAPATYTDAGGPPRLVVDLAALAPRWSTSAAAVALVPSQQALDGHETWHVVFSSHERADPPSPPASASVTYTTGPVPSDGQDQGATGPAGGTGATAALSQTGADSTTADGFGTPVASVASSSLAAEGPPPAVSPPPPAAAAAAGGTPARLAPAGFEGGAYQYPLVWLVPLAVLIGCGSIGRSLTKDLRA